MIKGADGSTAKVLLLADGTPASGELIATPPPVKLWTPDQPLFPTGELIVPKNPGLIELDEKSAEAALTAIRAGKSEGAILAAVLGSKR